MNIAYFREINEFNNKYVYIYIIIYDNISSHLNAHLVPGFSNHE